MKKISMLLTMLLAAVVMYGATPEILFYENFDGGDLVNEASQDGKANELSILLANRAHYTDEHLIVNPANVITSNVEWASKNRGVTMSDDRQTLTFARIDAKDKKNLIFQYAAQWNWNPTNVQYKIGESGTWSGNLATTQIAATTGDWSLRSVTLPSAAEDNADLWVRIVGGTGYCNIDDVKLTGVKIDPIDRISNKTILSFAMADLTASVSFDRARLVPLLAPDPLLVGNDAPDEAFMAKVDFSETTPLMQNVAGNRTIDGAFAFKGGIFVDNSHVSAASPRDAHAGIRVNESITLPNFQYDADPAKSRVHSYGGTTSGPSANYERVTLAYVWTKDQFTGVSAGDPVVFNGGSKFKVEMPLCLDSRTNNADNGLRALIKNGDQYYISEFKWLANSITCTGDSPNGVFENLNAQKWLAFDPSLLVMPSDFTAAQEVVFDDVQAVGLFMFYEHQWHKETHFTSFTVEGVLDAPPIVKVDLDGKTGVAVNSDITVTANSAVTKGGGGAIADGDVASLFVLKKDDASGADVAFTGTIDAAKKVFTLNPSADLANGAKYYVALKADAIENSKGIKSLLTEATFVTVTDPSALNAAIDAAQGKHDAAEEGTDAGKYDAGSKAIILAAINAAKPAVTKTQAEIDAAEAALTAATARFDKAKVGASEIDVLTFDVAATGVDVAAAIVANSTEELFKALDGAAITAAAELFVLKETDASGANVAFTAAKDATGKIFTITPAAALKPATAYYVALKNRVVANADGSRVKLTEKTFTTGIDSLPLLAKIEAAEKALTDAGEEGVKNGDVVVGAKATLEAAIAAAITAMRAATAQTAIETAVTTLDAAITAFEAAVVAVDYTVLDAAITAADAIKNGADYAGYWSVNRDLFDTALADAKTMSAKTDATQAEVDAAKEALLAAQVTMVDVEGAAAVSFSIAPNPASDYIIISGIEGNISIFNAVGQQVKSIANYSGEVISIGELASGIYSAVSGKGAVSFIKK